MPLLLHISDGCVCLRVVEFASRSDMKSAISKFDGTELNGRKLKVFEDSRKSVSLTTNTSEAAVLSLVLNVGFLFFPLQPQQEPLPFQKLFPLQEPLQEPQSFQEPLQVP